MCSKLQYKWGTLPFVDCGNVDSVNINILIFQEVPKSFILLLCCSQDLRPLHLVTGGWTGDKCLSLRDAAHP